MKLFKKSIAGRIFYSIRNWCDQLTYKTCVAQKPYCCSFFTTKSIIVVWKEAGVKPNTYLTLKWICFIEKQFFPTIDFQYYWFILSWCCVNGIQFWKRWTAFYPLSNIVGKVQSYGSASRWNRLTKLFSIQDNKLPFIIQLKMVNHAFTKS